MKQINLFEKLEIEESQYTGKIEAPQYIPRGIPPHILELYDRRKTQRIIRKIQASNISDDEKTFLIKAAERHTVFHYEKIADYYASASQEVQELMEDSALIIIDFEKAIQLGYIRLSEEIHKTYLECYES